MHLTALPVAEIREGMLIAQVVHDLHDNQATQVIAFVPVVSAYPPQQSEFNIRLETMADRLIFDPATVLLVATPE
jgi:hypothetical protein